MLWLFAAFAVCFFGAASAEPFHHIWVLVWLIILLVGGAAWYAAIYVRDTRTNRGNPRRVDWHIDTMHVNFYVAIFFGVSAYLFFSLTVLEAIGADDDGYSPVWALARDGSLISIACFAGMALVALCALWVAFSSYRAQRTKIDQALHSMQTRRGPNAITLDDSARVIAYPISDFDAFIEFMSQRKQQQQALSSPHPQTLPSAHPYGPGAGSHVPLGTTRSQTPAIQSGVGLKEVYARINDPNS